MNIAIFGGTGFLGAYLVEALIGRGHYPILMARPETARGLPRSESYRVLSGDLFDEEIIRRTLSEAEAVIYNIGILREFPRRGITFESLQYERPCRIMDIARERGIERFLLTSANGAKPDGTTYQRTKYLAERHLHKSELAGTVFRPSVIFGPPGKRMEFVTRLFEDIIRAPMPAPLFHEGLLPAKTAGRFSLSPIHVRNVVEVYVRALTDPAAVDQTYLLCGSKALEWRAILKIIGRAAGRNKWTMPVPVLPMKIAAGLLEGFPSFPLTRDQLTMLLEGNTGDSSALFETYGIDPIPFNEKSLSYLQSR
uniref:NADH dehydrogenase n=1 Tax=Candidatus Kentrum sp. DK TaxID=2126562 RepID=A0A450SIQ6_9GAMM|nr:MAG: NADH dehydrogenase [Candidatus Kentron sp. DK]